MTFEEMKASITNIGKLDKVEDIRSELLNLQKSAEADYTLLADITKERDQLKSDNESLRTANNRLWLQIGTPEVKEAQEEPKENSLKYADLFDDKGGLKL